MKKILPLFLIAFMIASPVFAAWDKTKPAGNSNASDIDTLVVANNTALESLSAGIYGTKNLIVTRPTAATIRVRADSIILQESSDLSVAVTSLDVTCTISVSGANGLDSGVEAISTWYYVRPIRKSSDGTTGCLLSTSSTAPTMPAGYDQSTLVSAARNDASSNFISFYQYGNHYRYDDYQSVISTTSPSSSFADIDCSSVIPPISQFGLFNARQLLNNGASTTTTFYFRPNGSSATGTQIFELSDGHGSGSQGMGVSFDLTTDSSQVIEYKSESQQLGIKLGVVGFELY